MTECNCPACRGLNDERHDVHEVQTQEVEVEVTFKERIKMTISVRENEQDELDEIDNQVHNIYVDVEVEDWEVI